MGRDHLLADGIPASRDWNGPESIRARHPSNTAVVVVSIRTVEDPCRLG